MKLVCGWLPPVEVTIAVLKLFELSESIYRSAPLRTAYKLLEAGVLAAEFALASIGWECAGI